MAGTSAAEDSEATPITDRNMHTPNPTIHLFIIFLPLTTLTGSMVNKTLYLVKNLHQKFRG
jgi:hypothetical protein